MSPKSWVSFRPGVKDVKGLTKANGPQERKLYSCIAFKTIRQYPSNVNNNLSVKMLMLLWQPVV